MNPESATMKTTDTLLDSQCQVVKLWWGKIVLHCNHQVFVPDPYCRKTPPKAVSALIREQCCRCGCVVERENRW